MDKYRLVMPPAMFIILALPFWMLAHTLFCWSWHVATAVFCGGVFGYIGYDLTRYFIHHSRLSSFYQAQRNIIFSTTSWITRMDMGSPVAFGTEFSVRN